jgi:CheY-like chemotaxis protein/HPt (histidine-containing phosphotransfer) domain-containing protein
MRVLEKRGHAVILANNGREALDAFHRERFDAILMDVQMPEMNGFEATAAIRALEEVRGGHIPIIAMTANALKGDRERCLESGMDDYIAKPIRSGLLISVLERAAGAGPADETPLPRDDPPAPADGACEMKSVFDPSDFRRNIEDDDVMHDLIAIYEEDSAALLKDLELALGTGDAGGAHRAAHALKGMLGNYSAARAYEHAAEIDARTRSGDLKSAAALLPSLKKEAGALRRALNEFDAKLPTQ